MALELLLWIVSFVIIIALIAVDAYQYHRCIYLFTTHLILHIVHYFIAALLICLSDLECDYINPYDSSSRINAVVVPEFIVQGFLSSLFLMTWQLIPFIIMAPITYYHVQMFWKKKHLLDVTEIFRQIEGQKKYRMVKLAFYFTMFILVIYRLVVCAVTLIIDEDDSPLVSGVY